MEWALVLPHAVEVDEGPVEEERAKKTGPSRVEWREFVLIGAFYSVIFNHFLVAEVCVYI